MSLRNLFLVTLSFLLTSCNGGKDKYNFVYRNVGNEDLWVDGSGFSKYKGGCGSLPAKGVATYKMVDKYGPVPEEVAVIWKRQRDGKVFERTVKVREQIPKGEFNGDIVFSFEDDDVILSFRAW